ncbi:MAG: hypothetical protein AAF539_08345 [Planctomycetota bacterium]
MSTSPSEAADHSALSADDLAEEQFRHVQRRLFRLLEEPDRPLLAIDACTIPAEQLDALLAQFAANAAEEPMRNLVFALTDRDTITPDDQQRQDQNELGFQAFRDTAMTQGFEGSVATLCLQDRNTELAALKRVLNATNGSFAPLSS